MRRAAIQAFRTARRGQASRFIAYRSTSASFSSRSHASISRASFKPRDYRSNTLQAAIVPRSLTLAVVSSVGAIGAWYALRGNPLDNGVQQRSLIQTSYLTPGSSSIASTTFPASDVSPTAGVTTGGSEQTRRGQVVDNDLYMTEVSPGEQSLVKEVDTSGRIVAGMLSPEQATTKLRQLEQSYYVGRGKGVVRYDYTQVPSNNPIEDDHVEKILEVSENTTPAATGSKPDWMFWGVFDGHR